MSAWAEGFLDLRSPQPRSIRLYLKTHGWEREPSAQGEPSFWRLPTEDGTYEVIAPSSERTRDFQGRVEQLLRTVSVAEDREPAEVLRDVATTTYDVQYIDREFGTPPGTAPLRDTAELYAAAQGMVAAAASSLEEPRSVHPSARPAPTNRLLRQVLAGPTVSGSYVITVWTPIPSRLTQEDDGVLFDLDDEPYPRRATVHLHTALRSARAAARGVLDNDDGIDTFLGLAGSGVSANLCESLVALSGQQETPLNVRFAWALDRPISVPDPAIRFESREFEVLGEAARVMRRQYVQQVRLRGQVIRLHRETQLGSGDVTILGLATTTDAGEIIGKLRRVLVELNEQDYQRAIRAHDDREEVEVTGSLEERGSRSKLTQVHDFTVLPELEI